MELNCYSLDRHYYRMNLNLLMTMVSYSDLYSLKRKNMIIPIESLIYAKYSMMPELEPELLFAWKLQNAVQSTKN